MQLAPNPAAPAVLPSSEASLRAIMSDTPQFSTAEYVTTSKDLSAAAFCGTPLAKRSTTASTDRPLARAALPPRVSGQPAWA